MYKTWNSIIYYNNINSRIVSIYKTIYLIQMNKYKYNNEEINNILYYTMIILCLRFTLCIEHVKI